MAVLSLPTFRSMEFAITIPPAHHFAAYRLSCLVISIVPRYLIAASVAFRAHTSSIIHFERRQFNLCNFQQLKRRAAPISRGNDFLTRSFARDQIICACVCIYVYIYIIIIESQLDTFFLFSFRLYRSDFIIVSFFFFKMEYCIVFYIVLCI